MEIEGIRPLVISDGLHSQLDRYRAFRHLVRHAYERELLWEAMKELVRDYAAVSAQFQDRLNRYVRIIEGKQALLPDGEYAIYYVSRNAMTQLEEYVNADRTDEPILESEEPEDNPKDSSGE